MSVNTVSTHMQHLYAKLGVHRRHEAVRRARALGLLAPRTKGLRRKEVTCDLADSLLIALVIRTAPAVGSAYGSTG